MKRATRYLCLLLLCYLGFSATGNAQVLLRASIDRDSILIGEPIILKLEARYPLGQSIRWVELDSIPFFEIRGKDSIETKESVDGKQMTQQWKLSSYDTGYQTIPSFRILVNGKEYYSDTLGISVHYEASDSNADYRDINAIEEVEIALPLKKILIISIGSLLILVLVLLLFRKKKKPVGVTPIVAVPPIELAREQLQTLRKEWAGGRIEVKEYYTRLTEIFREFMAAERGWTTQEKTSEELILKLRTLSLSQDHWSRLSETLRRSDMVKFAKYIPAAEENEESMAQIEWGVQKIHHLKNSESAV